MSGKRTNYRWMIAIFAMLTTFIAYMDRVNLSVAAPAIMQEFGFSKIELGMVQTAFFLCYALFQIPAGTFTQYLGHRKTVPFAIVWWSVFTSLSVTCQQLWTWIVVRGLFGAGESPIFPGLNAAIANWFPKLERGKAVSFMLTGSHVGAIIGVPLAVWIMVGWGWRSIFIVFAILGLLIAFGYYVMLRTHPHESPFVNAEENEYIVNGRGFSQDDMKVLPPWKDFFSSSQFWLIGAQYTMVIYISNIFIAWLPVYLLEAHHFSLKEMGVAAIFPQLGMVLGNWLCGIVSDHLVKRGVPKVKIRVPFAATGMILCGASLCMTAISNEKWITIMWMTFALAFQGFAGNTAWTTCSDMGGRFSGAVAAWMNFCGNFVGASAPAITAWISIIYGWQAAFFIAAMAGGIGAIIWCFIKPDIPLKHRYSTVVPEQAGVSGAVK